MRGAAACRPARPAATDAGARACEQLDERNARAARAAACSGVPPLTSRASTFAPREISNAAAASCPAQAAHGAMQSRLALASATRTARSVASSPRIVSCFCPSAADQRTHTRARARPVAPPSSASFASSAGSTSASRCGGATARSNFTEPPSTCSGGTTRLTPGSARSLPAGASGAPLPRTSREARPRPCDHTCTMPCDARMSERVTHHCERLRTRDVHVQGVRARTARRGPHPQARGRRGAVSRRQCLCRTCRAPPTLPTGRGGAAAARLDRAVDELRKPCNVAQRVEGSVPHAARGCTCGLGLARALRFLHAPAPSRVRARPRRCREGSFGVALRVALLGALECARVSHLEHADLDRALRVLGAERVHGRVPARPRRRRRGAVRSAPTRHPGFERARVLHAIREQVRGIEPIERLRRRHGRGGRDGRRVELVGVIVVRFDVRERRAAHAHRAARGRTIGPSTPTAETHGRSAAPRSNTPAKSTTPSFSVAAGHASPAPTEPLASVRVAEETSTDVQRPSQPTSNPPPAQSDTLPPWYITPKLESASLRHSASSARRLSEAADGRVNNGDADEHLDILELRALHHDLERVVSVAPPQAGDERGPARFAAIRVCARGGHTEGDARQQARPLPSCLFASMVKPKLPGCPWSSRPSANNSSANCMREREKLHARGSGSN